MLSDSVFDGFEEFDWKDCPDCLAARRGNHVYVFILCHGETRLPFYVGETSNIIRRIGDYAYASFYASADFFKVGESIKYLVGRQYKIELLIKRSAACKKDELALIRELQVSGVHLLNNLGGFRYWESKAEDERKVLERFCEMLIRQLGA